MISSCSHHAMYYVHTMLCSMLLPSMLCELDQVRDEVVEIPDVRSHPGRGGAAAAMASGIIRKDSEPGLCQGREDCRGRARRVTAIKTWYTFAAHPRL